MVKRTNFKTMKASKTRVVSNKGCRATKAKPRRKGANPYMTEYVSDVFGILTGTMQQTNINQPKQ
jgi:hypothetical protein